ncbi:MAG TPA: hypothetical protein VGI39_08555, partial [Polyangiaceae bacterium]
MPKNGMGRGPHPRRFAPRGAPQRAFKRASFAASALILAGTGAACSSSSTPPPPPHESTTSALT